jgi:hypothetical protein
MRACRRRGVGADANGIGNDAVKSAVEGRRAAMIRAPRALRECSRDGVHKIAIPLAAKGLSLPAAPQRLRQDRDRVGPASLIAEARPISQGREMALIQLAERAIGHGGTVSSRS